jgi:hypothetical protein
MGTAGACSGIQRSDTRAPACGFLARIVLPLPGFPEIALWP